MTSWTTIQETPNQPASSIVFTSGATVAVNAPASKVFNIITDGKNYDKWNTWTPNLTFADDDVPITTNSEGKLTINGGGKNYDIPIKILEFSADVTGPGPFAIAWRGQLLPSWFGVAERVQTIASTADGKGCEVVSWESMSGWGVYVLDFFLGIKKDLVQSNLKYVLDLKAFAERQ